MNVFLSTETSAVYSIQALDDVRLNKQCVEVYQLLTSAIKEKNGEIIKGHRNHPVYLFYKDNTDFLAYYGISCCCEYKFRFGKKHKLESYFTNYCSKNIDMCFEGEGYLIQPDFTPYYMEGSKGQPNYIRTKNNVSELFQQKLIKKWNSDKEKGRPPKWTNREIPKFYQKWLKENGND